MWTKFYLPKLRVRKIEGLGNARSFQSFGMNFCPGKGRLLGSPSTFASKSQLNAICPISGFTDTFRMIPQ